MQKEISENNNSNKNWQEFFKFLPLIMFVVILPVVIRVNVVEFSNLNEVWLPQPFQYIDIYSLCRAQVLWLSAGIAICIMSYGVYKKKLKLTITIIDKSFILFLLVVTVSAVFSNYKSVVIMGYADRWNGLLTWFSYGVMYYYGKTLIQQDEKNYNVILNLVIVSGFILGVVGLTQFVGADLLRMDFIKALSIPQRYKDIISVESLKFVFSEKHVYMTLYNPNNVGIIVAGMMPLVFRWAKNRNMVGKILAVVLGVLLLISLVGSGSRAGLVALGGGFIFYIVINLRIMKRYIKNIVAVLAVVVLLMVGINFFSENSLSERLMSIAATPDRLEGVQDITVDDNQLIIKYDGLDLVFSYDKSIKNDFGTVKFNDKEVGARPNESGYYEIQNPEFLGMKYGYMTLDDGLSYVDIHYQAENLHMRFAMTQDGYRYYNGYGRLVELPDVEMFGFVGYQKIGSNRGYIWSRSLPLIMENPIIGSGPDTFVFRFPQTDYMGKYIYYRGNPNQVMDKPHNEYIGLAVQFGLLGLLIFLFWIGLHIKSGYRKIEVCSVFSILITYLFYDSSIHTGWILMICLILITGDYFQKSHSDELTE